MKYIVFSLYEDITDGRGLCYREVERTNSIFRAMRIVLGIILDDRGYKGAHGWSIQYASSLGRYTLDQKKNRD